MLQHVITTFCPTWSELHAGQHRESVLQDGFISESQLSRVSYKSTTQLCCDSHCLGPLDGAIQRALCYKKVNSFIASGCMPFCCSSVPWCPARRLPGRADAHNSNSYFKSFVCSKTCGESWDIKPKNHSVQGWRHTCCTSTNQICTSLDDRCWNSACKGF